MLPPPLKLPPTPAAITRSQGHQQDSVAGSAGDGRHGLRRDRARRDHLCGWTILLIMMVVVKFILISVCKSSLSWQTLLRHQMLLSCFLSSRSNDGDLNNQVAAILHLGNISFVEAGNEVVIAVLILGFVLCHHYSR